MRSALSAVIAAVALAGCASLPPLSDPGTIGARAADYAIAMEGRPYRYGGNTPRGFDCSGLVQYSYARAGAHVPRSTKGLWRFSRVVSTRRLRPGDLLFFDERGRRSSHVGIYIGHRHFVHAPSTGKRVSVGSLTNPYWRRHFDSARRPNLH